MPYGTINGQINLQNSGFAGGTSTTTSTTLVSTGVGTTTGTSYTGRFLILVSGALSNGTAGDGWQLGVFRTTSGTPAVGAATTGSQVTNAIGQGISAVGGNITNSAIMAVDSPGIGTFTYYIAFASVTGGTTTIASTGLAITVVEL